METQVPGGVVSFLRVADRISIWSGRLAAWLIIPMVGALTFEVVARYFFNKPTVWAYDVTYMLYGALFMLGAAYTLQRQGHIRTDILYDNWSPRTQGTVDALMYVLVFFPTMIAFLYLGWDFFVRSFFRGERVVSSPWMPVVYPFKAVIPATCALLIIQGSAELVRSIWAARHGVWPPREVE